MLTKRIALYMVFWLPGLGVFVFCVCYSATYRSVSGSIFAFRFPFLLSDSGNEVSCDLVLPHGDYVVSVWAILDDTIPQFSEMNCTVSYRVYINNEKDVSFQSKMDLAITPEVLQRRRAIIEHLPVKTEEIRQLYFPFFASYVESFSSGRGGFAPWWFWYTPFTIKKDATPGKLVVKFENAANLPPFLFKWMLCVEQDPREVITHEASYSRWTKPWGNDPSLRENGPWNKPDYFDAPKAIRP